MKKYCMLLFEQKRDEGTLCYLLLRCLNILIKFTDSTMVILFSVFVRILKRYDGSEIFFDRGREGQYFPTLFDIDSHLIFIQLASHLHTDHELVFTSISLSLLFTFALILMRKSIMFTYGLFFLILAFFFLPSFVGRVSSFRLCCFNSTGARHQLLSQDS